MLQDQQKMDLAKQYEALEKQEEETGENLDNLKSKISDEVWYIISSS